MNRSVLLLGALCGSAFAFICTATNASIVVIDYNSATPGSLLTANYPEDGFTMESTAGHYDIFSTGGTSDTAYLGLDTTDLNDSQVRFTGGVFNLVSLETFNWTEFSGELLTVTSSGGGNSSFDTDAVHTFSGTTWSNLTWVNFTSNASIAGPGFDTLTLNTVAEVPVPAAVWLFGSGLLGLIGVARYKITA